MSDVPGVRLVTVSFDEDNGLEVDWDGVQLFEAWAYLCTRPRCSANASPTTSAQTKTDEVTMRTIELRVFVPITDDDTSRIEDVVRRCLNHQLDCRVERVPDPTMIRYTRTRG